MDNDTKLISEMYDKIAEGLFDRLKARASGVGSTFKSGIPQRTKGLTQKLTGKLAGSLGVKDAEAQLTKSGSETLAKARTSSINAKTKSIINSHVSKIEKSLNELTNDIKKLGISPNDLDATYPETAKALRALTGAVNNLKSRLRPEGQVGSTLKNIN